MVWGTLWVALGMLWDALGTLWDVWQVVVPPPRWQLGVHHHIGKSGTQCAAANVAIAITRPNWTPSCAAAKIGEKVFGSKNRVRKN